MRKSIWFDSHRQIVWIIFNSAQSAFSYRIAIIWEIDAKHSALAISIRFLIRFSFFQFLFLCTFFVLLKRVFICLLYTSDGKISLNRFTWIKYLESFSSLKNCPIIIKWKKAKTITVVGLSEDVLASRPGAGVAFWDGKDFVPDNDSRDFPSVSLSSPCDNSTRRSHGWCEPWCLWLASLCQLCESECRALHLSH